MKLALFREVLDLNRAFEQVMRGLDRTGEGSSLQHGTDSACPRRGGDRPCGCQSGILRQL